MVFPMRLGRWSIWKGSCNLTKVWSCLIQAKTLANPCFRISEIPRECKRSHERKLKCSLRKENWWTTWNDPTGNLVAPRAKEKRKWPTPIAKKEDYSDDENAVLKASQLTLSGDNKKNLILIGHLFVALPTISTRTTTFRATWGTVVVTGVRQSSC